MGPYKPDQVAPSTYNSNVDVGAFKRISSNIASAITAKEDRKDAACMKTGKINNLSYFVAGDIDLDSGKINSLILPERTQGHIDTMAKPKEETIAAFCRMFNTNNQARPQKFGIWYVQLHG